MKSKLLLSAFGSHGCCCVDTDICCAGINLFTAILWIVFQATSCRPIIKPQTTEQKSLAGAYLVFGWGPDQDVVDDYPVYISLATIQQNGDTWQMTQIEGQKIDGVAKEKSHAVGSATKDLVAFGWAGTAQGADEDKVITKYGSAEYRRVNDDILIGPWSEYGSGNVGFEELVRLKTADGYYVNLHTDFQKAIRRQVASRYASSQVKSGKFLVHGWLNENGKNSVPDYRGSAIAQTIGNTVHFTFDIPEGAVLAVGILRPGGGITMGWWTPRGDWGSASLSWNGWIFQGIWTKFDSPVAGYERLLGISDRAPELL